MEVKKPDGKTETWMVEGGTPNTLQRRGITRDSLKIGTVIVVDGFKAKDGSHAGQRPRHHVPRRPHAVHGLVGHRRAAATGATRTKPKPKGSER